MPYILFFIALHSWAETGEKSAEGIASYYANFFEGRLTANGEYFSNNAMTCAHKTLPFNTKLKVTRTDNQAFIYVRVNDRGPFVKGRIVDLSQKAAKQLGMYEMGICSVRIEIVAELPLSELGLFKKTLSGSALLTLKAPIPYLIEKHCTLKY